MSTQTFCDIADCRRSGDEYLVEYVNIQNVPTGNSDYSTKEEKTVKNQAFDLCAKHTKEYEHRMASVIIFDEEGLRFP